MLRLAVAGWCYVVSGRTLFAAGPEAAAEEQTRRLVRKRGYSQAEGKDGCEVSVALMLAPLQHPWNWALSLVALVTKAASLLTPMIVG